MIEPSVCWPWSLRICADLTEHPIGERCGLCRRDVALPRDQRGRAPVCIYCALDTGLTPEIDVPLDEPLLPPQEQSR